MREQHRRYRFRNPGYHDRKRAERIKHHEAALSRYREKCARKQRRRRQRHDFQRTHPRGLNVLITPMDQQLLKRPLKRLQKRQQRKEQPCERRPREQRERRQIQQQQREQQRRDDLPQRLQQLHHLEQQERQRKQQQRQQQRRQQHLISLGASNWFLDQTMPPGMEVLGRRYPWIPSFTTHHHDEEEELEEMAEELDRLISSPLRRSNFPRRCRPTCLREVDDDDDWVEK